jgi:hypothetical protein
LVPGTNFQVVEFVQRLALDPHYSGQLTLTFAILSPGRRIQQIGPRFLAPHQQLLLLQALELLVVELRGAALVRGEISGHGV